MSSPNVAEDTLLEVDLEKPLICEARWVDREDDTSVECENIAEYSAVGHDEVHRHKNAQTLLCQDCVTLLTIPSVPQCECGDYLISNVVRL